MSGQDFWSYFTFLFFFCLTPWHRPYANMRPLGTWSLVPRGHIFSLIAVYALVLRACTQHSYSQLTDREFFGPRDS